MQAILTTFNHRSEIHLHANIITPQTARRNHTTDVVALLGRRIRMHTVKMSSVPLLVELEPLVDVGVLIRCLVYDAAAVE